MPYKGDTSDCKTTAEFVNKVYTDSYPKKSKRKPGENRGGYRGLNGVTDHEEKVPPGTNSRYIKHALKSLNMPPFDIRDPKQVEERCDWYVNQCIEDDVRPTVMGFCNSLGIERHTLMDWLHGTYRSNSHQSVVKKYFNLLNELWENYMNNGEINPAAGIFLGHNHFGYREHSDNVVKVEHSMQRTSAELSSKYATVLEGNLAPEELSAPDSDKKSAPVEGGFESDSMNEAPDFPESGDFQRDSD